MFDRMIEKLVKGAFWGAFIFCAYFGATILFNLYSFASDAGVPVSVAPAVSLGGIARLIELAKWLYDNAFPFIGALVTLCNAVIGIALLLPGPQPEKFLYAVVEFLEKLSKKKKDDGNKAP